ncbi:MAG: Rpn family recombination-promoting nuclease/putative transposase [Lachnospiraceae bacterium]|nr:Rpn family recombination-promoting nuclease/putative transposase [Lachnospiraceae bacterium]
MSKNLPITSDSVSHSFRNATGPIDYGFVNDYMFRTILQENERVLRGLICALLHLKDEDILSIEIKNPILPGDTFDAKEFILDVEITLNNAALINLEMQVVNEYNWSERSLSYLCRRFDQLDKGQDYTECKPAIHIGFLDFTPFPECPEFYATYKLLNIKNQHLYSDKFILSVVDLTHIELATDEDKTYGIDRWARLFKSTTWEEIKMIAENNPVLTEASEKLYTYNADEAARQRSQARAEYLAHERAVNNRLAKLTEENAVLISEKQEWTTEKQAMVSENQALAAENERLRAQLAKFENSDAL